MKLWQRGVPLLCLENMKTKINFKKLDQYLFHKWSLLYVMVLNVGYIDAPVPLMKMDRIQEVLLCERELMEDNFYKPLPVFVNLSFDEVCV